MKGFAALVSVIVIGSVMIFAGMMVTLTSINEGQMTLSNFLKNDNLSFMDACAEDALLFINESSTLPPTITTPQGNCTASINSQVGTSWDFNISATTGDYQRSSRIKLNRGASLSIGSWQDQ
jgi:hypothetical protein